LAPRVPTQSEPARGYAPAADKRPLGGYLVHALSDVLLAGAATHKLARLIAKDKVTSFARAPFTEFQGKGGPSEVEGAPRGSGLRYAAGELLVCPYCLGLWISDFLQLAYARLGRA
jgi:hypothetical protein